ncbi:MAG: IS630 family transposase [Planctomycetota bacterium]
MITIEFTQANIEALEYERYHHPEPRVQKRMEVLYLKSQGLAHKEICRLCHISKTTLVTYLKKYRAGGIERLKVFNYQSPTSELDQHSAKVEAYFKEHPPRTTAEAQQSIKDLTGIERSPTQIRAFMKRLGMKYQKVGYVPGGKAATPEKQTEQEVFKTQELTPRLEEAKAGKRVVLFAKAGKRVVLFMDAAHFVHGAFLAAVWCFTRLFIPSPSGRKRFNVLGAVDAVTKEILTFTNETYINAESVCQLLVQIVRRYGHVPITIVLDNARYQKCKLVWAYAAVLNIELLYLPSYSPHLNLIERLWRFVKKECLYAKYYQNFADFKQAIEKCIETANSKHKNKLETLLSWNFQSFEKVQISTV